MTTLNLSGAPTTTIERLIWLTGLRSVIDQEMDAEYQRLYFEARLAGQFETALAIGTHPKKRALAYTRHENEARGRIISRWNDDY